MTYPNSDRFFASDYLKLKKITNWFRGRSVYQIVIFLIMISSHMMPPAHAASRVALVIGNSNYENSASLPNPTNDADGMELTLSEMGFEVSKIKDTNYNKMRLALRLFSRKAEDADIALIFYAGHGMEVDRHNYLIPVDAKLASDRDIEFETIRLELLIQAAGGARELSLVLLDACRNNPFAASMKRTLATRSVGRGLAQVEPTAGTLVSFAAKEGTIANDGTGSNSPYTTALMQHLTEPGIDIQFLFRKVRDAVLKETRGSQEPFVYGSLPGRRIFLVNPNHQKSDNNQAQVQTPDEAQIVYREVKDSNSIAVLEAFIASFPDSFYARLALARITDLKKRREKENLQKQRKIAVEKENRHKEKVDKARKEWNFLKFTDDETVLQRFKNDYSDTPYAEDAARRIKYLKILRERAQAQKEKDEAVAKQQTEKSELSDKPRLISKHHSWGAYRLKNSSSVATCYVAGIPAEISPENRDHGGIFFMLTKFNAKKGFEPQLTVGFPFKTSSSVKLRIGDRTFSMFTKNNDAWVEKISDEAILLSAMKRSRSMVLNGFSRRGTPVQYRFSLNGVSAALNALSNCS